VQLIQAAANDHLHGQIKNNTTTWKGR
jgi:hypothetical protein